MSEFLELMSSDTPLALFDCQERGPGSVDYICGMGLGEPRRFPCQAKSFTDLLIRKWGMGQGHAKASIHGLRNELGPE